MSNTKHNGVKLNASSPKHLNSNNSHTTKNGSDKVVTKNPLEGVKIVEPFLRGFSSDEVKCK